MELKVISQPKKLVTTVKQGKFTTLKEMFQRLAAEDPFLAFIATILIFPLGTTMLGAVLQQDLEMIYTIILTLSGITIFVCIPLIVTKTWRIQHTRKTDKTIEAAENESKIRIKILENEASRQEIMETSKQHRFNLLTEAKIQDIAERTKFITQQSQKYEEHLLVQTAAALQKGFEESVGTLSQLTSEEHRIYLKNVLNELSKNNENYNIIMKQVEDLSKGMEVLTTKVKSPEEQRMEEKFQFATEIRDPNVWQCQQCKNTNNLKKVRCSNCGLSKAASDKRKQ